MRQACVALLRFYPAEYTTAFGQEIAETVEARGLEASARGPAAYAIFTLQELAGLALGIVREWTTKWTAREGYVTKSCLCETAPNEVVELQRRVQRMIRCMEFAIANHDFPRARFYSNEERALRRRLEELA